MTSREKVWSRATYGVFEYVREEERCDYRDCEAKEGNVGFVEIGAEEEVPECDEDCGYYEGVEEEVDYDSKHYLARCLNNSSLQASVGLKSGSKGMEERTVLYSLHLSMWMRNPCII